MSKKIGELLVELGHLTELQVEEILHIQKEQMPDKRFGQIAFEKGFISSDAINDYITRLDKKK